MSHKNTYRSGLSREQINSYGKASSSDRRKTEGAVTDGFDQDALDGWTEAGITTTSMKHADQRFRMKNPSLLIGSIAVAVAITGTILFLNIGNETNLAQKQVELSVEQTDAILPVSIDTLQELPEKEQIQIASIRNTQREINEQPEDAPLTVVEDLPTVVLEPIELKSEATPQKISIQKTAKEIYLHDLKLIDYSQYRSKPVIPTERIVLTGTPADEEKKDEQETETEITQVDIPYMDYIDKTMDYVNRGKWKQSLQRLQLILETYPDDVNAHFYAGLCCYNLQQFVDAQQHFASCLQLSFNNFNEEAAWYLAQSMLANGEKSNAKEMLILIRDQKGYYSKQAEKLLKGIK
jgi:TolA-binding protein